MLFLKGKMTLMNVLCRERGIVSLNSQPDMLLSDLFL